MLHMKTIYYNLINYSTSEYQIEERNVDGPFNDFGL